MTIDRYTKFVLTLIAVGIMGLNFFLFSGQIVKPAFASGHQVHKVALCNVEGDCAMILKNNVKGLKGIAIASRW